MNAKEWISQVGVVGLFLLIFFSFEVCLIRTNYQMQKRHNQSLYLLEGC